MNRTREILITVFSVLSILISCIILSRFSMVEHCLDMIYGEKGKGFYEYMLPKRNFKIQYCLSGQDSLDNNALISIERSVCQIKLTNNDSMGIKVVLSGNLKYDTYIKVLNICLKSGITDWIPYEDTIFIFHKPEFQNQQGFSQNSSLQILMDI